MKKYFLFILLFASTSLISQDCYQYYSVHNNNKNDSAFHPPNVINNIAVSDYDTILSSIDNMYDIEVFWVLKDGKWGLINEDGKLILPPKYDLPHIVGSWKYYDNNCLREFMSPIVIGYKENQSILFDTEKGIISTVDMSEIIENNSDSTYYYKSLNGKYGLINESAKTIIPAISEVFPFINGDSALVFIDNHFYQYCISKQKLGSRALSEKAMGNMLMVLFQDSLLGNNKGFYSNCSLDIQQQFLLDIYLNYNYPYVDNEPNLAKVLKYFIPVYNFDYCSIDWCFRSIDEQFNINDDHCWPPNYGTFMDITNSLIQISQTDYMYESNSMTYGHGSGDVSLFKYFSFDSKKFQKYQLIDLFNNADQLKQFLKNKALNSDNVKEMMEETDVLAENIIINDKEGLAVAKDGLHCMISYWEMGEFQVDLLVSWEDLKNYIPQNGKLEQIIKYLKK